MCHDAIINTLIKRINQLINNQLNRIIHHRSFQQLESSWRSLHNVVFESAQLRNKLILIKVLACSYSELADDLTVTHLEFDSSEIFRLIYTEEFDQPGGHPYSIIIGDYEFDHQVNSGVDSISVLQEMAKVSASGFTAFLAAASSTLFELNHWGEIKPYLNNDKTFDQPNYRRWKSLITAQETQFVTLIAPRIRVRPEYQHSHWKRTNPFFDEIIESNSDILWGNPAYRYASSVIRAFHQSGWFLNIRSPLPAKTCYQRAYHKLDNHKRSSKQITECHVTHAIESLFNDAGITTVKDHPISEMLTFYRQISLYQPASTIDKALNQTYFVNTQLPYILCAARFSQALKVMLRDKIGGFSSAEECEQWLQNWILQYCASSGAPGNNLQSKYPLESANISIKPQPNKPGVFQCTAHIKPHSIMNSIDASLKLISHIKSNNIIGEQTHA